jgi:predicted nucleic acid-binding protein
MRIGDNDVMIAATAIYHNLHVVTHNHRHFGRVPGLKIHPHP